MLRTGVSLTLIPLDVMRRALFSPSELSELLAGSSKPCRFLSQVVPFGIAATSNLYGIEGLHLKDVLGVVAVAMPEAVRTKPMRVDVETRGELTRGMSVFDQRSWEPGAANVDLVTEVDGTKVRAYIGRVLGSSA